VLRPTDHREQEETGRLTAELETDLNGIADLIKNRKTYVMARYLRRFYSHLRSQDSP
jgi:hypothetical protein